MAKQDDEPKNATETAGQSGAAGSNGSTPKTESSTPGAGASEAKPTAATSSADQPTKGADAISLLKEDHRKVETLFSQYEAAPDNRKDQLIQQICRELVVHAMLEEEIFYPACRRAASDEDPLDEAQVEHDSAKLLIADLMEGDGKDAFRDAKVSVLAEQIRHHVKEEEEPSAGIFARAQQAGVNTPDLGRRIATRKEELAARRGTLAPSHPVSIQPTAIFQGQQKENPMARQDDNGRERDDRGRFMSDDDRGGRSRYDRDDDDRGYRSRGRNDDDRGRGRGWSGDPEGHSEASRQGWAERRGEGRSFSRYDDDDRRGGRSSNDRDRDERGRFAGDDDDRGYRSRSDYDDDRRSGRGGSYDRDRDERGRFASDDDDRRYQSRGRNDDDDDRGRGRGWFGDSEGHSEASRRGWDERDDGRRSTRSSRDDDDGRSRSRSRDDDDDRRGSRSSSGRGQGGWFGDSRGHAEAARRGWEDRR